MTELTLNDVKKSYDRIKDHIIETPVITNKDLNAELGANIFFKLENLQKTGSFKIRGATNNLLSYFENHGHFPENITTASSGNHGAAMAYLSEKFNIKNSVIFIDKDASKVKIDNSSKYNSQIVITDNKLESNRLVNQKIDEGYYMCNSYGDDDVILGQATICFEALNQIEDKIEAIFTPCGGGGLAAGTYITANSWQNRPKIFTVEPENANDAQISVKNNKIFCFDKTPDTIADGARTLWLSDKTFPYIKKLDNIYTASEEEIKFWYKKLTNILQFDIEPTSILAMVGANKFIKEGNKGKNILIILSGGNI